MNIFSNHLLDWIILILIMGAAFYTMRVIGRESSDFKDECYQVQFGKLNLMVPNWWTLVEQTNEQIQFARTDTFYSWKATFSYFPDHQEKTLPHLLEEKFDQEKIEFDQDVTFETDSRVLFRNPEVQEYFQEVIRVEGKASQDVVERIYYDIYLMRAQNDQGYFIFESLSSVLNGLVEGPYFEESLSELKIIHDS